MLKIIEIRSRQVWKDNKALEFNHESKILEKKEAIKNPALMTHCQFE